MITSLSEPNLAIFVNSNNKIIGFRKITETKKRFNDMVYNHDFDIQHSYLYNKYKEAFQILPTSSFINKRDGVYKWEKDGKIGIVHWVKHYSVISYTEFYEDLIDESLQ